VSNVDLTAPGKLIALCVVIAGCFTYIITALFVPGVETTPAWATLTLVVGYLVGNGTGARKGVEQAAVFSPKDDQQAT
jgi:hypothetical protein